MRTSRWLMIAVFAGGLAAVVDAQPPRERQPGGDRGPGGRGFGGFDLTSLVVSNEALQEELKVTAEQKTKFKAFTEQQEAQREKMRELFKDAGGDREKMREIFQKAQEEREKELAAILTADQKERISQIELQRSGIRAFTNEEVVSKLGLNESQQSKIKAIVEDYNKNAREVFGAGRGGPGGGDRRPPGGGDRRPPTEGDRRPPPPAEEPILAVQPPEGQPKGERRPRGEGQPGERRERGEGQPGERRQPGGRQPGGFGFNPETQAKLEKLQKVALADIMDVLTDEQVAAWKKMTGKPFDLAKLRPAPRTPRPID